MADDLDKLEQKLKTLRESKTTGKEEKPVDKTGQRAAGEFFAHIFAGCLIGYLLDRAFDSTPIAFVVFMLLGIITGYYRMYMVLNYNADDSIGFAPLQKDKKDAKKPPESDKE